MTARCELYLENPEQHRDHLAGCESCRRLENWLNVGPDSDGRVSAVISRLPVAPWEGAAYRAWGIVAAAAALVVLGATALFLMSGVSPVEGFLTVLRSLLPGFDVSHFTNSIPQMLREAPIQFHLVVLTAFILVNAVFFLMLRRPPKGYDVTIR